MKRMEDKYNEVGIEVEADGFITRAETLERVNANKAKPISACPYPNCEECFNYCYHYCTVPIVVNKQMWKMMEETIQKLQHEIKELWDEMFTEEIEVEVGKDGKLYRRSHAPCIVISETP